MPHENKMYMPPKSTGTIPKVKQRNNNNAGGGTERRSNLVSNNLGNEFETSESNRGNRNQNRNFQFFHMMDTNQENGGQNGIVSLNPVSCNDSNTNSRRNSSGLSKCDNVTKYPDKKQIEQKLSQIQEYLQVATSMKANMKKTDEQIQSVSMQSPNNLNDDEIMGPEELDAVIKDLTDSALKLQTILDDITHVENCKQFSEGSEYLDPEIVKQNKNDLEHKVDVATRDLQMLKEQENYLLHLQLNAETKLREARLAQARLANSSQQPRKTNSESEWNDSDTLSLSGASSGRNADLRELEERIKAFKVEDPKIPLPEQFQGQIDHLQNHIQQMREGNDNRTQLIQILDSRDAQLQAQHNTLQGKLQELQNKKNQVDQLVVQLQTMNEESEGDEMGHHVKKIVNMKEQLTKLKDMLNLVQTTENSLEGAEANDGINSEIEENVNRLIAKTDNLMQQNRIPHVENVENAVCRTNYPPPSSNERRVKEKQVNKKSMSANEKERMKLQAEMRAKRKELEELMCKHKAANSNLNHDNHSEKNSEMGTATHFDNATNAWYPMDSNIFNTRHEQQSSDSDDGPEEDPNEFSEMNSSGELNTAAVQPMPVFNYSTTHYIRKRPQEAASPQVEMPHDSFGTLSSRSPARSVRSVRSTTPAFPPRENATNKTQLQKQLELIKTVCDSMLDSTNEETEQTATAPVRVRNNLTPSPIYSEQRHFSPRPNLPPGSANSANAWNIVNYPEPQVNLNTQMSANISPSDATAYNNWLTTNSLQTQAFILNTLNQCCQMLWHQQKELSTLRNTVNVMQDRFGTVYHDENNHLNTPLCMQSNPCIYQPNHPNPNLSHHSNTYMANNYRHHMAPKTNQMTAHTTSQLNSGSMPNLNGCAHPSTSSATNMEHAAFCNNMLPNNNAAHQQNMGEHQLNTNHIMHPHPNQNVPASIWNGQALNNQVAPGNRANNYWDNFRSYSRQNLFSTKSNDGTQNIFNERQSSERRSVNQDLVSSTSSTGLASLLSKSNSNHNEAVVTSSVDNSPRRIVVPRRRVLGRTDGLPLPSHSSSIERTPEHQQRQEKTANNEVSYSMQLPDMSGVVAAGVGDSPGTSTNDWSTNENTTKLVDDLRENVYKEVASLISANEERPHFLIQLFQDLQLVSSDPLRRNILQNVHELITNSLASVPSGSRNISRQHQNEESSSRQNENYSIAEENCAEYELLTIQQDASTTSDGAMSDIIGDASDMQRVSMMWPIISKHAMSVVSDQESQDFHEAPISSFLNMRHEEEHPAFLIEEPSKYILPFQEREEEIPRLQILVQNGDLAEADQSCAAEDDDEGAVGGLLNIFERSASSNAGQIRLEDEDLHSITEDENEQGLDQVPTRLSNPPSIGCSPK